MYTRYFAGLVFLSSIGAAWAQTTPVGLWRNIDDKTGEAKAEIRIASLFKQQAPEFLEMVAVHELAHLREREHNKAFYQLCRHMLPDYDQIEFDLRLLMLQQALEARGTVAAGMATD